MRIFAYSALAAVFALPACTAKERNSGAANGGAAGVAGTSGSAGSDMGGSGAEAGAGGVAGSSGSAGSAGTGGSAGTSGSGGAAGAGGTGPVALNCAMGPAFTAQVDPSVFFTDEPIATMAACQSDVVIATSLGDTLEVLEVQTGTNPNPVRDAQSGVIPGLRRVVAAHCSAAELKVLAATDRGIEEYRFQRVGGRFVIPAAATGSLLVDARSADVDCVGTSQISHALAFYDGSAEPHVAFECARTSGLTTLFAGPPVLQFQEGMDLRIGSYAYSAGIHVVSTEDARVWAGSTAAEMTTTHTYSFEDPVTRPTMGILMGGTPDGFMAMGVTTNPPPTLFPGRIFTGPVLPNELSGLFVGGTGTLPAGIRQRREITSADEFGPTSALSVNQYSAFFSIKTLQERVLASVMNLDGEFLLYAHEVYAAPSGSTIRRVQAKQADNGLGYAVAWVEVNPAGESQFRGRSMTCF